LSAAVLFVAEELRPVSVSYLVGGWADGSAGLCWAWCFMYVAKRRSVVGEELRDGERDIDRRVLSMMRPRWCGLTPNIRSCVQLCLYL
jgi:hypothetical protein